DAASAVAATTVISLATLFVFPVATLGFAAIGTPVPPDLIWVALGGACAFVALFGVSVVLLFTDRLLIGGATMAGKVTRHLGKDVDAARVRKERDELRDVLGA